VTPIRLFRPLALLVALLVVGACGNPEEPDPLVGTYYATTFTVSAPGQGNVNVLAVGGSLGLNVATNYIVTGTLIIPPVLNGGTTLTESMGGVLDTAGTFVRFVQPADTFVRQLSFTFVENRLEAVNQTVDGKTYELILTRQ
jgi:hypothetical protein